MRTSLFFLFAFFLFATLHYDTKSAFGDEDAKTKAYWETLNKKNQEWIKRNKTLPDDAREIDSICNGAGLMYGLEAPYRAPTETVCQTALKEWVPRDPFFRNLKGISLYIQAQQTPKEYPVNRDTLIRLFKPIIDKTLMPDIKPGSDCKPPELHIIDTPPFTNNLAFGEKSQSADILTIVVNLSFLTESMPQAALITHSYYRPHPECKALVPRGLYSFAIPLNLSAQDVEKLIAQNINYMYAPILSLKRESWSMLRYRCDKENARIELEKFHFWDGMHEYNGVKLQNPRDNDIQEQGKDVYYAELQENNTNLTPIHLLKSPLTCEIAGQKISLRPAAQGEWYIEKEKNEKKSYAAVSVSGYWRPFKIGDTTTNYLIQRSQSGQWEFCADRKEEENIRKECESFSLIEDNFTPPVVYPFREKANKKRPASKYVHKVLDCHQLGEIKFVDKSQLLADTAFFDPSTLFSFLGDRGMGVKWCVKGALEGGNMCKILSDKGYVKNYDRATKCAQSALSGKIKEQIALANFFFNGNDFKNAEKWLHKAAKKGSVTAWVGLGDMYSKSNEAEAIRWYRMAAEKGNQQAQRGLGEIYLAKARSNPKMYEEAFFWWALIDRTNILGSLAWHLTAEQIAAVQKRVKEWKENHKTDAKKSPKTKK